MNSTTAQVRLRAVEGTVWLTQAQVAELDGTSVPNIAQIIGRVLADGEATEATINSELVVRQEGARQVRENEMRWAVTGRTAPEILANRSDPAAPNVGLTNWSGSVVRKSEVGVAKNHLNATRLSSW